MKLVPTLSAIAVGVLLSCAAQACPKPAPALVGEIPYLVRIVLSGTEGDMLSTAKVVVPGGVRVPFFLSGISGYPAKYTVQGSLNADTLNSIPTLWGRRAKGYLSVVRHRDGKQTVCMDLDWIQDSWGTKDFDVASSGGSTHRSIEVSHGDIHPVGAFVLNEDPAIIGYPPRFRPNGMNISPPFLEASILPQ